MGVALLSKMCECQDSVWIRPCNTLAVPVVTYSFNIINWTVEDLKKLDRKTRKLLTMGKMDHPKADKDRLYLPRKSGGRGLIQIERTYKTTTIGLNAYINNTGINFLVLSETMTRLGIQNHCTTKLKNWRKSLICQIRLSC